MRHIRIILLKILIFICVYLLLGGHFVIMLCCHVVLSCFRVVLMLFCHLLCPAGGYRVKNHELYVHMHNITEIHYEDSDFSETGQKRN